MIAELFYPKELKQIIKDLEAQENLRREPLKEFNKGINTMVTVAVIITCLSFKDGFVWGLMSILLFLPLTYLYIKNYSKHLSSYCIGHATEITIHNIRFRYFLSILISYEIKISGRKKIIRLPSIVKNITQLKGKEFVFYCLDNGYGMPDIPIFKSYFCLRKDLM